MPRRCKQCYKITPPYHVNFCPHCGIEFRTRTLPPMSTRCRTSSVSSSSSRISSASSHGHHSSVPFRPRSSLGGISSYRPVPIEKRVSTGNNVNYQATSGSCEYKIICGEYLSSLKWEETFFNRRHNLCYCKICYPISLSDTYEIGGSTYVVPRGWCRFGLQVDQVRAQGDKIWDQWIVTYHGTSSISAQSIVSHRQFLIPGDTCMDGERIHIGPGHIKEKYEIYTSPTIAYSSHPCYCPIQQFESKITQKVYNAQIVLQCRQKPGTFKVQGETINAGKERLCPIIPNNQIEILTSIRASVVPYAILIRLTEVRSNDYN